MAGFMGDNPEGTFRKATGSVFPDCFIIGVSVQSSEGSQFSWKAGKSIIASEGKAAPWPPLVQLVLGRGLMVR